MLTFCVNGVETPTRDKLIRASNKVYDIVRKSESKYGEVKKYYNKFALAVGVLV
jgi:hypothetical protein